MSSEDAINIDIVSQFQQQGVTAAQRGILDLSKSAQQIVAELRAVAVASGASETEFLAMAGAASTAAMAVGSAAQAEQILAVAMGEEATAAASATAATEGNTVAMGGLETAANSAKAAMGELGVAMGGIMAIKLGIDLAETGAQAALVETRFNSLATAAHTTGGELLTALRSASGGEVADTALELDVMKSSVMGVGQSAAELTPLMALARDRAQEFGITTEQAFDRLVVGLGRVQPKILDDIGIIVNITHVNDAYANSIGKTSDQLTDAEKKQALLNEVMRQGAATAAAAGGAVEGTASQIAQGKAGFENLKVAVGGLAAIKLGPLAEDVGKITNALAGAGSIGTTLGGIADLGAKFNPTVDIVNNLTKAVDSATIAVGNLVGIPIPDTFSPLRDSINQWLNLLGLAPSVQANATTAANTASAANTTLAATTQAVTQATTAETDIEELRAQALGGVTPKMLDQIAADQTATTTTQKLTDVQATLASLGVQVAGGILTAGNAALQLAGMYGIAYAKALQLINAQAMLAGKSGVSGKTNPGFDDRADVEAMKHAGLQQDAERGRQEAADVAAARRAQVLATGTSQAKIAILKKEYDDAARVQGEGSVAAINAQTKLLQAQESGSKARVGAAGAAGAKLESIETKTEDKIEKIVSDTQKKITAITEREAAKQAAALQKLNEDIATSAADRRAAG
jgi:hypothetical protein